MGSNLVKLEGHEIDFDRPRPSGPPVLRALKGQGINLKDRPACGSNYNQHVSKLDMSPSGISTF